MDRVSARAVALIMLTTLVGGLSGCAQLAADEPRIDPGLREPVIEIENTRATVAGVQGRSIRAVYADGTVLAVPETGLQLQRGQLAGPEQVRTLVDRADELGLLAAPDMGEPQISDQGWSSLVLRADGQRWRIRVYAPDHDHGLNPLQLRRRAVFSTFEREVTDLSGVEVTEPMAAAEPERLLLRARPSDPIGQTGDSIPGGTIPGDTETSDTETSGSPLTWTLPLTAREAFEDGCHIATGPGTGELTEQFAAAMSRAGGNDGPVSLPMPSGVAAPAWLQVTAEVALPGDDCPAPSQTDASQATPSQPAQPPLVEPWPGTDRAPATAWQRWVADGAVARAAEQGRLGGLSATRASYYPCRYAAATTVRTAGKAGDGGRRVVDVVGGPHPGGNSSGPKTFSLRVDETTGELIEFALT